MSENNLPKHQAVPTHETMIRELEARHGVRTVSDLERVANKLGMRPSELMESVA